jgi:hypothetical protein
LTQTYAVYILKKSKSIQSFQQAGVTAGFFYWTYRRKERGSDWNIRDRATCRDKTATCLGYIEAQGGIAG